MPWYVVRTKPQHEIKSSWILEDLGLEVYCPVISEVRQWSDRKKKVIVPLFKSYLFVNLETNNRKRVFEAPGVINFVHWLRKPAIAREEEIDAIKAWMNNDKLDDFKVENLRPGEEVEIRTGKFAKQKVIIKEVGDKKVKLVLPGAGWVLTANIQDVV